jgi:hypothetical protein
LVVKRYVRKIGARRRDVVGRANGRETDKQAGEEKKEVR